MVRDGQTGALQWEAGQNRLLDVSGGAATTAWRVPRAVEPAAASAAACITLFEGAPAVAPSWVALRWPTDAPAELEAPPTAPTAPMEGKGDAVAVVAVPAAAAAAPEEPVEEEETAAAELGEPLGLGGLAPDVVAHVGSAADEEQVGVSPCAPQPRCCSRRLASLLRRRTTGLSQLPGSGVRGA